MRAALVGAVDFNSAHFKSMAFDYVVAVDAGWSACQDAGVAVDLALGDFDSLGYVPQGVAVEAFPAEKDESDMELAFQAARRAGADEVYVYGALSQRLDHTLANLQVMMGQAVQGTTTVGIGADMAVTVLAAGSPMPGSPAVMTFDPFDPASLEGSYAPHVSILALACPASGLSVSGLAYEVDDFSLSPYVSRGLSNEFTGDSVRIALTQGCIIVVFPLKALAYASF